MPIHVRRRARAKVRAEGSARKAPAKVRKELGEIFGLVDKVCADMCIGIYMDMCADMCVAYVWTCV